MEEKEKADKVDAVLPEDKELTQEEETAAELHWKTKPDRIWLPEAGGAADKAGADISPEEEAEARQVLEDARRRAEDVPEEELHPSYKKMVGIGTTALHEGEKAEAEKIVYGKCGDCGASVPVDQLQDNGSFLACPRCY